MPTQTILSLSLSPSSPLFLHSTSSILFSFSSLVTFLWQLIVVAHRLEHTDSFFCRCLFSSLASTPSLSSNNSQRRHTLSVEHQSSLASSALHSIHLFIRTYSFCSAPRKCWSPSWVLHNTVQQRPLDAASEPFPGLLVSVLVSCIT